MKQNTGDRTLLLIAIGTPFLFVLPSSFFFPGVQGDEMGYQVYDARTPREPKEKMEENRGQQGMDGRLLVHYCSVTKGGTEREGWGSRMIFANIRCHYCFCALPSVPVEG